MYINTEFTKGMDATKKWPLVGHNSAWDDATDMESQFQVHAIRLYIIIKLNNQSGYVSMQKLNIPIQPFMHPMFPITEFPNQHFKRCVPYSGDVSTNRTHIFVSASHLQNGWQCAFMHCHPPLNCELSRIFLGLGKVPCAKPYMSFARKSMHLLCRN